MGDIECRKCREPWDAFAHTYGEMTDEEHKRFMGGEGCPSCRWGTVCVHCYGTGKQYEYSQYDECSECSGRHSLHIHRAAGQRVWRYGYEPQVYELGWEGEQNRIGANRHKRILLKVGSDERFEIEVYETNVLVEDGVTVTRLKIVCPFCEGIVCSLCNGSGEYTRPDWADEAEKDYLRGLFNETDEDPLEYLSSFF
jgi:hypothetical protein